MFWSMEENRLIGRSGNETLMIEGWGKNALRVRATQYPAFTGADQALEEPHQEETAIEIGESGATVTNGKITAKVTDFGQITFYRDGKVILDEYYRQFGSNSKHSPCLQIMAREFKPIYGGDYQLKLRFCSQEGEKIFGLGQYQQPYLDLKGCTLEMAQRNSQISVPSPAGAMVFCGTTRRWAK